MEEEDPAQNFFKGDNSREIIQGR